MIRGCRVLEDAAAVAREAGERVVAIARRSIAERGALRLALSGGSTPVALYRTLATSPLCERIEWERVTFLFADERAVPRGDRDRNDRLADETLLGPLGIEEERILRMRGDAADLDAAALEYEAHLETPLDLAILGVGPDGHTASIFPRAPASAERERRCVAVDDSPKPPPRRLTLAPRALREARAALVLVTGEEKAAAVAAAFDPSSTPVSCPASLLRAREWLIDHAAARELPPALRITAGS